MTDQFEPRRLATDDAEATLAECLMAETEAERRFTEAELAVWRKRDAAAALSDDDSAVEDFVTWLPQGRRAVTIAQVVLERASAEVARARAALSCARNAAVLAESLVHARTITNRNG